MNDDLSMNAMEYALGTLSAEERADFARQLAGDPDARAALADWERKFTPLAGAVEPIEPDSAIWRALEQKLPDPDAAANVVTLRRSARSWRFAAIATSALAACLALSVAIARPTPDVVERATRTAGLQAPGSPTPQASPINRARATENGGIATASASRQNENLVVTANGPRDGEIRGGLNVQPEHKAQPAPAYIAALAPPSTPAALIVRVDPAASVIVVRRLSNIAPPGKVLRLWLLAPGAQPRALGAANGETTELALPREATLAGATIAASFEPEGSSADAPGGPFVFEGRLVRG